MPGVTKDAGTLICPHYRNTAASTGFLSTLLNANILPVTSVLSSPVFESQGVDHSELLVSRGGCFMHAHGMLQGTAGHCRYRGAWCVCRHNNAAVLLGFWPLQL